uniref:Methyltransferase FkbM domain-containing protein n=1 Tax=Compsopogon caeruleus TaxID=31354 RepID=A0A7S1T7W1_9RHOD|mmetsp:Transcript_10812/g.21713  ORF Transcript_10812/g.21713 Transcript_10812/m.21713 type:complete len:300 (+) Transcript_10812:18-917(+)
MEGYKVLMSLKRYRLRVTFTALCVGTLVWSFHVLAPSDRERELNPVLYNQGLSHIAFHQDRVKMHLANLVASRRTAIVVGVEWGAEVAAFASRNYKVHAFEPLAVFHDRLAQRVRDNQWNVNLYKIAAGSAGAGKINLTYNNNHEEVAVGKVDDYVSEEVDVFSVDVQGVEFEVLRGAERLIKDGNVRSLWIELFACSPNGPSLFQLLQAQYEVFDFVPWGQYKSTREAHSLLEIEGNRSMGWSSRPSTFPKYQSWFCNLRMKEFSWAQTDLLAIRRDLVTPELLVRLSSLSQDLLIQP